MTFVYNFDLTTFLDRTCQIMQVASPTFAEGARAQLMQTMMETAGLEDISQDPVHNVYGRLAGGSGRPLVISAHLDTVHSLSTLLEIRKRRDEITGPGIGDNSVGLSALIELAYILKRAPQSLPGDVWFIANSGEEGLGNLCGMRAVVERFGAVPVAYLVIEGMGLGQIYHRGLGIQRYRITMRTPGGHAWSDYGTPSAIHELVHFASTLASIPLSSNPRTSLNVGTFHGGVSINTIASEASIELEIRSENPHILSELIDEIQQLAQNYRRPPVEVELRKIGERPAGSLESDHPLVALAASIIREQGMAPVYNIASTDANVPLNLGFPSVCLGVTRGGNAHTVQEFIRINDIPTGIRQWVNLITQVWDI